MTEWSLKMNDEKTMTPKKEWQKPELHVLPLNKTESGANPFNETMTTVGSLS